MVDETFNSIEIRKDYDDHRDELKKQISVVELRQNEIQNYIMDLDANVVYLRAMIQTEKDAQKSKAYRGAIASNIDLLVKLYSVNKEYEDVKVKYYKESSTTLNLKHRLIEIDIRKINEKMDITDKDFMDVMKTVMDLFSANNKRVLIDESSNERITVAEKLQNEIVTEDKVYDL